MTISSRRRALESLVWGFRRLSLMSLPELWHRVERSARAKVQSMALLTAQVVPEPNFVSHGGKFIERSRRGNFGDILREADSIMNGRARVFASEVFWNGNGLQWNVDPKSGKVAPVTFGKLLNYRDEELVGDIKYLWEPNRHLHLVTLAQAYALSGNDRYLSGIKLHLSSWLDQCPYLMGPNWTSSLELAIRLINWSLTWQLIGGLSSPLFQGSGGNLRARWLNSIYQHSHFIHGNFSRYSSANNHLIGEAAGLFVAGVTWPYWNVLLRWRKEARQILEEEILKQNSEDGVNWEQAVSYQQFVLDFLITSALAGRRSGIEFSRGYWSRLLAMLEFLASTMDVAGNVPMIGDADDGYVVKLTQGDDQCPYRSLLHTGAVLFQRTDFLAKSGKSNQKSLWLLGDNAAKPISERASEGPRSLPIRRSFPLGGYYLLGCDFETEDEVKCLVDCGPLGYLSIAAHGHADALSMYLTVGGREFLVDPGTYAYHTERRWRDYFRGTSAHNTVRVDKENQSVMAGAFMWSRKANAYCDRFHCGENKDLFIGWHDGYTRLKDPVIHRREIEYLKRNDKIIVRDHIICSGEHIIERFWHFSELCSVRLEGFEVVGVNSGIEVRLEAHDDNSEVLTFLGDDRLPLGWVSRRFDVKVPTRTVVWRGKVRGTTFLQTEIAIRRRGKET
jgi:hypothetical protein